MDEKTLDRMEDDVDMESDKTAKTLSTAVRLQLLERDARGLSRMMTTVIETLKAHGKTLQEVEEWQLKAMLDHVRAEEQQKALLTRLDTMTTSFHDGIKSVKDDIGDIKGAWKQFAWAIFTPIIGAVGIAVLVLTFGKGVPLP